MFCNFQAHVERAHEAAKFRYGYWGSVLASGSRESGLIRYNMSWWDCPALPTETQWCPGRPAYSAVTYALQKQPCPKHSVISILPYKPKPQNGSRLATRAAADPSSSCHPLDLTGGADTGWDLDEWWAATEDWEGCRTFASPDIRSLNVNDCFCSNNLNLVALVSQPLYRDFFDCPAVHHPFRSYIGKWS